MTHNALSGAQVRTRSRRSGALVAVLFAFQAVTASFADAPQLPASASLKSVTFQDKVLRIRLDSPVSYRVFSLASPSRLVVELSNTVQGDKSFEAPVKDDILQKIRFAQFKTRPEKITRVVLEVSKQVPFKAEQDGNDIFLRFEGAPEAAASAPAPKPAQIVASAPAAPAAILSGEMEETVESAATSSSSSRRRSRMRDILANLPRNPVTIDFDDAEISDVLRVLSEMSGINIIHAANVRGSVSVHLDQVPFNEAFQTILAMQGLVAQQMGSNILRILTPEDLNTDRARAVVTYKTFSLNYAKASEIQALLASVKISPSAKAEVDERNNALIVTDTPEGLAAAERLISELDIRPQQVLIEAKIVEVSLNNSMDLGVRWEYFGESNGTGNTRRIVGQATAVEQQTSSLTPPEGGVGLQTPANNFITGGAGLVMANPANPAQRGTGVSLPNTNPSASAISFGFINNTDLLTMTLNALASEGKTKVLSSPRVITLNNKNAKIQVGSKLPFSTVTIAQSGVVTQAITFVDVGIILDVTPVINADSRVRLKVKPEVSLPGQVTTAGPQINTRNAETEVIIRDGETLVIGGLIDEQTRQSVSKVPLLGDIPILGMFFRNSFDQKNRTELLIFVTPRIVRD